MKFEVII